MVTITLGIAAIFCLWWLLAWHTFQPLFTPGPSDFVPDPDRADPLEAHRWLKLHLTDATLAPRRFGPTAEALRFVDRLYELGAVSVRIAWLQDDLHAYGLLIMLPRGLAARQRLFAEAAREAMAEGLAPAEETGQSFLRLVWND